MSDRITAGTITLPGAGGDPIEAYLASPDGPGPRGSMIVIHHFPGYDRATKEITRRFAELGYAALCPNLYSREAPGASPDDAAAAARANGGVPDERLVGDVEAVSGYLRGLASSNGKVGIIGYCSGGRHAFLAGTSLPLDAAIDCYGAFVVGDPPGSLWQMGPLMNRVPELTCPLLGLFGDEDTNPSPAEVRTLAAALEEAGKEFEFHSFEGAGHSFFSVDRPAYRQKAAVEGWEIIEAFLARTISRAT